MSEVICVDLTINAVKRAGNGRRAEQRTGGRVFARRRVHTATDATGTVERGSIATTVATALLLRTAERRASELA